MLTDERYDYLALARDGLPGRATSPRRVIVIGAGMAGLVAAEVLLRAGYDPLLLEARGRVGGRVETLRAPFAPGLYAEAGAMRLPRAHALTMAYLDKFNLPREPFTMGNRNGFYHFGGTRCRIAEAQADPDCLGFPVADHERGVLPGQRFKAAIAPIAERLDEGESWERIIAEYDQYSTREFLEAQGWSAGAIEQFGLVENQESRLNMAFIEVLLHEIGHSFADMYQIPGGTDLLPRAFLPTLAPHIRYGAALVALEHSPEGVTAHCENAAGRFSASGDYAILTLPFAALRHVEVTPRFSPGKHRAIRQLNYDASAKVFLQCRRRFWEEDDGIVGGSSHTDLAVRNVYYPEHGRELGRGVLVASYTWAQDAERWGSLEPGERIAQALEDVACIHPQVLAEFEVGASKVWHSDPYAGGAFALFEPGQKTLLHEQIIAPEGRVYFAGEHCSLMHRWIQGAIESGLRAAMAIHEAVLAG